MGYEAPLLVTGGSGRLARLVIEDLIARGVAPSDLIATTRSPARLADLAARGVHVRIADFDEPLSLTTAFAGARRVLIVSTTPEAPYVHGKRFRQQKAAVEAAVRAGVEHVFYTSAPNPEPGTPAFWKQDHYDTELAVKACGRRWTILRHWEWPDWHLAWNWLPALTRGEYVTAAGPGRIAHITRADCARADAGALLSSEVANRCIDIIGPESLTSDEIMSLLSARAGKPVRVLHVSPEELAARLAASGANPDFIPVFVALAQAIRLGLYDGVTRYAETLSGSRLTRLGEFLDMAL